MMLEVFDLAQSFTRGSLTHSNFQNLINSNDTNFDLVMTEMYYTDAYMVFAKKFNSSLIGLVPQTLPTAISWLSGNPLLFSYIPVMYLPISSQMSFLERSLNTIFGLVHLFNYEINCLKYHQQTVQK